MKTQSWIVIAPLMLTSSVTAAQMNFRFPH